MLFLDQILERSKGTDVYKRGEGLQKGLIDIDKVYSVIQQKQDDSNITNAKDKWKAVMSYMEANPNVLVDTLPVTAEETYQELLRDTCIKPKTDILIPSKRKQRLMKDLEVSK